MARYKFKEGQRIRVKYWSKTPDKNWLHEHIGDLGTIVEYQKARSRYDPNYKVKLDGGVEEFYFFYTGELEAYKAGKQMKFKFMKGN